MDLSSRGAMRLFRAGGIEVFLHWSWFVVALLQITSTREPDYNYPAWRVAEYLSLFGIVLLHEFGHALACRSVGGQADRIVLWPLGGIAYVAPPPRPGALLWSIAAGPLVNVVLLFPLFAVYIAGLTFDWPTTHPDLSNFLKVIAYVNLGLLIFNMLPIYPLDGGQVLHALLWFPFGRWMSLLIVSVLGMFLGGALVLLSFFLVVVGSDGGFLMLALIAVFIVLRSLVSFQHARAVLALEALPRHFGIACPTCGTAPPHGPYWLCEHCQTRFDLFDHKGHCPACGAWYLDPLCPHCFQKDHIDRWLNRRES